jgi:8-oxo-dGTP diphosphatase
MIDSMKKHLRVSAAVIEKDGKVFAAQRGNHGELALRWEFPGGKLELGETPEQALVREIKEELDTSIEVIHPIVTVEHEYETFSITLYGFLCRIVSGSLPIKEHIASRWLEKSELSEIDWAAADTGIVQELQKNWEKDL